MGLNPEQIEAHQSCNKLLHSAASNFYLSRSKSKQKRVLHMSEFGSIVSLLAVTQFISEIGGRAPCATVLLYDCSCKIAAVAALLVVSLYYVL